MVLDVHIPQKNARTRFDRQYSMNIGWSNSKDAVKQGAMTTIWDGLNPGMRRFVDLGHMYEPKGRQLAHLISEGLDNNVDIAPFHVGVEVQGSHKLHLLPPGEWEITLVLSAANHKSRRYTASIKFTGAFVLDPVEMLGPKGIEINITPQKRSWDV